MIRPVSVALLVLVAGAARGDAPMWIDQPAARPWIPALTAAALHTDLPVALLAELIGQESGFRNIKNAQTSAYGYGQQIANNTVMQRYHLDRTKPAESILGAAIEFREQLNRTGSLAGAARAYGTTAGLPPKRSHALLERLIAARSLSVMAVSHR